MPDDVSIASLMARVKRLEHAIKPIAAFAAGIEARTDGYVVASHAISMITAQDIRRCRDALGEWAE